MSCACTYLPLLLLLSLLGFTPTPAEAAVISPITVVYNASTAELVLRSYAAKYKLSNPDDFIATAKCESGFDAAAVGDHNSSFGVFQIHAPAHKELTKAQMLDPWTNIDWAARQFSFHNERIWTCYRMLKASDTS